MPDFSRREFCVTAGLSRAAWWCVGVVLRGGSARAADRVGAVAGHPRSHRSADFSQSRLRHHAVWRQGRRRDGRTAALHAAIAACANAGGGRVVVPSGQFLTGAIRLQSRVNLHLADEAVLRFSQATAGLSADGPDALRGRRADELLAVHLRPGRDATSPSPAAARSTVRRTRTIGGRGRARRTRRSQAPRMLQLSPRQGVPVAERVFGDGHFLRPNFIQTVSLPRTCSSRASRSSTRRCGRSIPSCRRTSRFAA